MPVSEKEDDCDAFYRHHRGGMGAVVVATAIHNWKPELTGIFGSLETAQSWGNHLGNAYTIVYAPYIVDDPDWGNEAIT